MTAEAPIDESVAKKVTMTRREGNGTQNGGGNGNEGNNSGNQGNTNGGGGNHTAERPGVQLSVILSERSGGGGNRTVTGESRPELKVIPGGGSGGGGNKETGSHGFGREVRAAGVVTLADLRPTPAAGRPAPAKRAA